MGVNNVAFGYQALRVNTDSYNTAVGANAGTANTTGSENSFFGENAGAANTTGDYNSFFGRNAGAANSTGGFNSFLGGMLDSQIPQQITMHSLDMPVDWIMRQELLMLILELTQVA